MSWRILVFALLLVTPVPLLAEPVARPNPLLSPDGRYSIGVVSDEVRMSHWVDRPYIVRTSDGSTLWEAASFWSLDSHQWVAPGVEMELRRYPGDQPSVRVRLDLDAESFELPSGQRPIGELNAYLDSLLQR